MHVVLSEGTVGLRLSSRGAFWTLCAICCIGCSASIPGESAVDSPSSVGAPVKLVISSAPSSLPADGATLAAIQIQSDAPAPASVGLGTTGGSFPPSSGSNTSVTLVSGTATAILRAPAVVGDSILIVSGSVAGSVAVDTVHVVRAYPQALSIVPDSFSISDTLGRRTITATALRVPGFVTRGTRVFFAARSSDSLLNGHAVGTFDSPALTDSLGNVTVHYTLNGDGGLHRDSVTVFATVFGPTANDSVTGRVTLTISPKFAPDIVLSRDTSTFHAAFGGVVTPAVDSIFITNGGTGALSGLSLSTPIYSAGGSGWLKTSLVISTANPALLTMVANSGGLSPGIYTASVLVTSTAPGAINNPATLTVTLTIM